MSWGLPSIFLSLLLAAATSPVAAQEPASPLEVEGAAIHWIQQELDGLVGRYRHLHAHPELSFQEEQTAATLAGWLKELGIQATVGVGGHGLVAVVENGPGPVVLVRTDTDALPIEEKTGLEYASRVRTVDDAGKEVPVMHACGHDMHMAVWLGTAAYLAQHREDWSGTLVLIAQPAEERGAGAKAMLADGLFERFPVPDYCLALHVTGQLPAGSIGIASGYALANVDSVDILVRGRGGHGSTPHKTLDPVVLASRIVVDLQTIVSREISPLESAVVTVGSIHGGSKHNIIPDEVRLQLTVRSYKAEVREHLLAAIRRTAVQEAKAAGFPEELLPLVEVSEKEFTHSTYNDPDLSERTTGLFQGLLGAGGVFQVPPVMGGEDFGRYGPAAGCPSLIYWLGVSSPGDLLAAKTGAGPEPPGTHNSGFAPVPGASLRTGVLTMTSAVLELLPKVPRPEGE